MSLRSPMERNGKEWGMVATGSATVAAIILVTPVGLLETIVTSFGVSEIFPSAAPPLGITARSSIAFFAALMTFGILAVTRRTHTNPTRQLEDLGRPLGASGADDMGFALSKLSALARSWNSDRAESQPALRRADAHPDAPHRKPIFASRDFEGVEIYTPKTSKRRELIAKGDVDTMRGMPSISVAEAREPFIEPIELLSAQADAETPSPHWDVEEPAPLSNFEPSRESDADVAPQKMRSKTSDLSITELTQRLEIGLIHRAQKRHSLHEPKASNILPEDREDALELALLTLKSMTNRTG